MKKTFAFIVLLLVFLATCSSPASETITDLLPGSDESAPAEEAAPTEEPALVEEPITLEESAASEESAAAEESVAAAEASSLTSEEVSTLIEAAAEYHSVDVASAPAATIDTGHYYHLQTMFLEGENKCLEGNQVAEEATLGGAAFMNDCNGASGELWKIVPLGNGYYNLQTQFLENENKCFEGNALGSDVLGGSSFMDDCQNVSGQAWKFVESEVDGYYRLQTAFLAGENKCLEGNRLDPESVLEGTAFMDNCLNVTGQLWKLVSPHWSYEGEEGPDHWSALGYPTCSTIGKQSPVNITNETGADLANIVFNYEDTAVNILNNGHTIEAEYEIEAEHEMDSGNRIQIQINNETKTYNLAQFHFHTRSEHAINGQLLDGEMHLVHKNADGTVAVVGVLIREGAENPAFAPVWDRLPAQKDETIPGVSINAFNLLPDTLTYYTYTGSFTTPPCTEGVQWFVLTTPIEMSAKQIEDLHDIIHNNNRPVQPLGERTIEEDITGN